MAAGCTQEQEPKVEVGPKPEVDAGAEDDCPATAFAVIAAPPVVEALVLANPVTRAGGCWRGPS
jgi:hypothetical protein